MALPKLFQRIFFHNDTTPAINEDNLNAISKGLDDLDDRVINLGGAVLETVPQIQAYLSQAASLVEKLEDLTTNPPQIGANGHWFVWDTNTGAYVDSGYDASITVSVGTTSTLPPGNNATVENVGTDTDPILNFGIPQGQTGQPGDDGVSPEVTVTTISGGHRVTITDADHPTGQSFDVMDGSGSGDMLQSTYDPTDAVASAGGIALYVAGQVPDVSGKMNTNGSNAASHVTFSGAFTVGSRKSGSTVGTNSTVEGYGCEASGNTSHAEGQNTIASKTCSHAEGYITKANGWSSHAEGSYTEAGYDYQHVQGKYNNNKSTTLMEIGNGTSSSARSNAFEVYSDGSLSTDNGTTRTKLPVIKSKTLAAGATSVTFDNMPSSGNNLIQFYTSVPGLDYTAITTSGTNTTLTYPAQSSSTTVYCSIVEVM